MNALLRNIPALFPLARKARSIKRIFLDANRFKKHVQTADSLRIVVGSSHRHDNGWYPTEIDFLNLLERSDWEKFFSQRKIDCILAEHVWEHLTAEQAEVAAKNCFSFLKPGGYLRVAVPDGLHPDPQYIANVRVNGLGPGADDHKVLYNYLTFSAVFERAGFEVELLEHFDEQGVFHARDWNAENGTIRRSKRYDKRNLDGKLNYTSIMLDAKKAR